MMNFLLLFFIVPIIHAFVVVEIHRNSWYDPLSSCAFIHNISWLNNVSIQSCIWECVNEYDCQTAVYFKDDKICSMFKEVCSAGYIQPSANDFISVICYRKSHAPITTCSSTSALDQQNEETTSVTNMITSTQTAMTNLACGSTCINTTTSTSSTLAFWSFDSITTDVTGNYPASGISSPTYVTGWVGSGVNFTANNTQRFSAGNIPLNSRSFTIEFWFYATDISAWDYAFMGEYLGQTTDNCLFINIRYQTLFFGFFADDTPASTTLVVNKWYHAAFVYDSTIRRRSIYLNGILDRQTAAIADFVGSSVPFTIGGAEIGGSTALNVYYSGIIDHVTVSSRVKSSCEIYLDANLACYFTFDSASSVVDSGPNFLTANNTGATAVTGRINQALQFSSSLSYITITGISALKSENTVFSISLWINPTNVSGGATLIHAATQPDGQGTCFVMWGLTSSGAVTVNVINATNHIISASSTSALPLNTWNHVAQTYSSTNGSRLYINGILVDSVSVATGYPVGPYAIIGASPVNTTHCYAGSIATGQFYGMVDEYRVFGVELTSTDVCRLAHP